MRRDSRLGMEFTRCMQILMKEKYISQCTPLCLNFQFSIYFKAQRALIAASSSIFSLVVNQLNMTAINSFSLVRTTIQDINPLIFRLKTHDVDIFMNEKLCS
jgi:hypothetical protein